MTQGQSTADTVIAFGSFRLLTLQRALFQGERPVRLGSRALEILTILLEHPGEVVSKCALIKRIWPDMVVEEGTLRVHVSALRKALGDGSSGMRYIQSVTGQGYRFVAPVSSCVASDTAPSAQATGSEQTGNLKAPLARIIGRSSLVAALAAGVPQRRFVTIVGPGGMGKTTVALAVADRLRSQYPGGVHFVDLASVRKPAHVARAVASTFRLAMLSEDSMATLQGFLQHRELLIVLDNCEHVIEAAAQLAEGLLRAAPGVHILATSREPLRAEGEWVQRLAPLDDAAAVQLFVERAAANQADFALSDEDVPLASHLCRRLDGLPLAIELAAASVYLFGVSGLCARLDDSLQLLKTGRRTAQERHRTLRDTLEWSYQLLSREEQLLLCKLSVFAGAFDTAAAAAVATDEAMSLSTVLDLLAHLVAKSLIVGNYSGRQTHYRFLDTTRTLALEKLEASSQCHATRRRHAELCCRWSSFDPEQPNAWLPTQDYGIDDVRAALNWCFSPDGDQGLGVQLTAITSALWFKLYFVEEYRSYVDRALLWIETAADVDATVELQIHLASGEILLYTDGPENRVIDTFSRALALAERLDDSVCIRRCLWGLWSERLRAADHKAALALAEKSQKVFVRGSDTSDRMLAVSHHLVGDQARARRHAEAVLEGPGTTECLHRSVLQFHHHVAAHAVLARILWVQGFADQALRAGQEGIDTALRIDHALSICHALTCAATVELWAGNTGRARELARMILDHARPSYLRQWQRWGHGIELAALARENGPIVVAEHRSRHSVSGLLYRENLLTFDPSCVREELSVRAQKGEAGWCGPEILRAQALSMSKAPHARAGAAEPLLLKSLELARVQGALAWELRTATTLASRWRDVGRVQAASDLLGSVHGKFTEGFATADMREAKAVLDSMTRLQSVGRYA